MKPVALAVLLLGVAPGVRAQSADASSESAPSPSADELESLLADPGTTAQQAYRAGVRSFEAARYAEAERAWLRAHAIGGDPTLLVAVADARTRRGDEPGAVEALREYLERRPDAPDRAAIEARVAALLQAPGQLIIRSREPGKGILLDGAPTRRTTPAAIEVEPGSHTVVVAGEDGWVGEKSVQIGYGEVKELDFAPEQPSDLMIEQAAEAERAAQRDREAERRMVRRAVIATGAIAAGALIAGTTLRVVADRGEQSDEKHERLTVFSNVAFGLSALSAVTSFTLFMTHRNGRPVNRDTAALRIDVRGAGASATVRF